MYYTTNMELIMVKQIYLEDIFPIENVEDYKSHFGRQYEDGENRPHPIDEWLEDRSNWKHWQETRNPEPEHNFDSVKFIFSMMQIYPEQDIYTEPDTWLFGGIFEIIDKYKDRYEVEQLELGSEFIGRLILRVKYRGQQTRPYLETHYSKIEVLEILRDCLDRT